MKGSYKVLSFIIDVSELLFPKIYTVDYIQSLDHSLSSLVLPNWTCNDADYTIFDFSQFSLVETIVIGDNCFASVKTFVIDGLNQLKSLKIGENSFTQEKNDGRDDESKSFRISNCNSLESIEIGQFSFSDFAGSFELKDLPSLQSLVIGTLEQMSCNFCCSCFVIRSRH